MKKILRIAIILAVILAIGFLTLVAIYFLQKKPLYYTSYENAGRYSSGSFSCDAREVDAIDISWLTGTLQFQRSAGSVLRVQETADGLSEKQQVRWWQDGRTLRIRYWASNYGTDRDMNKTLLLEIPDGIALTVRTDRKQCNIRMGEHQLKALDLQIGTGDIDAGALSIEQGLTLENGGGTTSIRSVSAESARFSTKLGEVRIDSIAVQNDLEMASIRAQLSLGTVKAENVKIIKYQGIQLGLDRCGSVDIRANRGDITLSVKQNAGAAITFRTGNGRLNGKTVNGSGQLVIGDGACAVRIEVDEGSLTVR